MTDRNDRKQRLLHELTATREPVTGADLATKCGVTRQVVVHDIALLRTAGFPIVSTPRGYILQTNTPRMTQYVLSVNHSADRTEAELLILVDHGIAVLDVIIEHPIYGELRGALRLSSRKDVASFMQQVSDSNAILLSSLTDGHHMHTIECLDAIRLHEAVEALRQAGIEVTVDP